MADRAFAVGSGYVYSPEVPGRMAKSLFQSHHIAKARLESPVTYHLERGKPLVDFLQHLIVFFFSHIGENN